MHARTMPTQSSPAQPADRAAPVPWLRWFLPALIATLVLDLATKELLFTLWRVGDHPHALIWLAYNQGVAWSMGSSMPALVLAVTLLLIPALTWYWWRTYRLAGVWENLAFGLVLGGALGNAIDRIAFRLGRLGGVRDFIHVDLGFWPLNPFPTFNIADSGITVGFALLVLLSLRTTSDPG
ncbi:MAG: signal peptidase II [Planctomycetes bacterium]|nr:signal peptidase II [Planctomycetota bacterium]